MNDGWFWTHIIIIQAPPKSLGVQKVIFRCEKESEGRRVDDDNVRMFTGKYGFNVRGEDVQA